MDGKEDSSKIDSKKDDHITIVFKQDNITTTTVARCKNYNFDNKCDSSNIFDKLGIESVPFNELVPKYEKICLDNSVLTHLSCSVCNDTYINGEYQRKLQCGHVFHKKCVDKWLKVNFTCPLCRQYVG